jgi:hypothetical protein
MDNDTKKYPEGYFLAIGLALGLPFGLVLAATLDNPGFIGVGLPFGLAIGLALEAKYRKEGKIRPLTEKEHNERKIWVIAGIVLLVLAIFVFWLLR